MIGGRLSLQFRQANDVVFVGTCHDTMALVDGLTYLFRLKTLLTDLLAILWVFPVLASLTLTLPRAQEHRPGVHERQSIDIFSELAFLI